MHFFETVLQAIKEKRVTAQIIRGLSVLLIALTITIRHVQLATQLATICECLNVPLIKSVLQIVVYGYGLYICWCIPALAIIIITVLATSDRDGKVWITIWGAANVLHTYGTILLKRMTDVFVLALAGLSFVEYECFIQTKDSLLEWIQNLPLISELYTEIAIFILLVAWVFSLLPLNDMLPHH